jgi:hypothetical protein
MIMEKKQLSNAVQVEFAQTARRLHNDESGADIQILLGFRSLTANQHCSSWFLLTIVMRYISLKPTGTDSIKIVHRAV